MTAALPGIAATGSLLACIFLYYYGARKRAYSRIALQRISVAGVTISATTAFVLFARFFDATTSDALSAAGLIVALVLGLAGPKLTERQRRIAVGIVIPSRAPFHQEVRRGLADALLHDRQIVVFDEYLEKSQAEEDLAAFVPTLRRACRRSPDYLILCPPTVHEVTEAAVCEVLEDLARRGGGVLFVENGVQRELSAIGLLRSGTVESDSIAGGELIADYAGRAYSGRGRIVVLAGPADSLPAKVRAETIRARIPKAAVTVADTAGWFHLSALEAALAELQRDPVELFICGNDTMALGAVEAIRKIGPRGREARVIGYDGIPRALAAIAEPSNPFDATVRIPPSAYGHELADLIRGDNDEGLLRRRTLPDRVIPITAAHLITRHNVDKVLDA